MVQTRLLFLSFFMIKTNQSGRSMVEMLGVLAIIGVLSVGGIAGYSKAMNKYKINKTTDQISMLVANIRTMFATQGSYKGLDNKQAVKFGIVPNDLYTAGSAAEKSITSSSGITNAFGGNVYINASDLRKNDDQKAFILAYEGLTQEACITIVTGDWGSSQGSGLIAIGATSGSDAHTMLSGVSIGGAKISSSGNGDSDPDGESSTGSGYGVPGGGENGTPISVTNAQKWCSDTGSGNAVVWKYY